MATFVHIADERHAASIRRNGLKLARDHSPGDTRRPRGIYALPLTSNFIVSHQWGRELKRRGFRSAVGVYFRLQDAESVWAGHYGAAKESVAAAQAVARFMREPTLGFEVIVPRRIASREITAIRAMPRPVGWRYFPDAHEKGVYCGCEYCQRGLFNSRGLRQRSAGGGFATLPAPSP